MVQADVEENFKSSFAIYDISRFLAVVSLFTDPELAIGNKFVTISEGKKKLNYTFADPKTVIAAPEKEIKLPSVEVEFDLSADVMRDLNRVVSVLRLPEIIVSGNGKAVSIGTSNSKDPTSDTFSNEVGETNKHFTCIFAAENMKLMGSDYKVSLCSAGISKFETVVEEGGLGITYFIAVEANSTFE